MTDDSTLRESIGSATSTLTTVAVALLLVSTAVGMPVAAASTDWPSQVEYKTGGKLRPSFIVTVENDSIADLQDWANDSDARSIVAIDNSTNQAVVAGPAVRIEKVGLLTRALKGALFATPLATRSWVERVAPNYRLELPRRPDSINQSSWDAPTKGSFFWAEELPGAGIAFNGDANQTLIRKVRKAAHVDDVAADGDGMTVAVVDTGINTANGELFGNGTQGSDLRILNASKNFMTNETVNGSGIDAVSDGNGHGSWVSSMIAANASGTKWDGMAPDAQLLVLKALNDDGSGSTENIADAVRYAANHDADILSLSLGSPIYSREIAEAVEYARDKGVLIVVATGNSAMARSPGIATPSDVDGVISVAATNGSAPYARAYFSQYGPDSGTTDRSTGVTTGEDPTLAMPGYKVTVRVATTSGGVKNSTLSGTSMAAPGVSGVAAVVWSAHPSWSAEKLKSWLYKSATRLPAASPHEVGHGMPNAKRAINTNETEQTQAEAMNDTAERRDQWYEGKSEAMGQSLARFLQIDPELLEGLASITSTG